MKILVVQQKMIGDVLMSSLLCEALKVNYKNAQVHYLINEHTLAVVDGNPYIDQFVFFKAEYKTSKKAFYTFLKSLKKENYDVVVDVYGKLESNLITYFSKAPKRITFEKWYTKFLYTHPIKHYTPVKGSNGNNILDRFELLKPLLNNEFTPNLEPKIYLSEIEKNESKQFLLDNGINFNSTLLMISILGSSPNKTYPATYMAQVLNEICKADVTLLFNYIPSQKNKVTEIYNLCTENTKSKIALEVYAPSLRKFLAVLAHCKALIGNEGGAVNMAKALHVPTFSIYSPQISKTSWHTFANQNNVAVHLNDFKPTLINGLSKKEKVKNNSNLYEQFEPSLFLNLLPKFLNNL